MTEEPLSDIVNRLIAENLTKKGRRDGMLPSYLLEEIISVTKDKTSSEFWTKAVDVLGPHKVEEELGELKHQVRLGKVQEPAKYLTHLLKKQMDSARPGISQKISPYPANQQEFLDSLATINTPEGASAIQKSLSPAYSGKHIPFPAFIGPEFFTLSTVKKKSDVVSYSLRTQEGKTLPMKLFRGKTGSQAKKEYGIPTVQHWRIFAALKVAWAEKGCRYVERQSGECLAVVDITAKELAKILGWETWKQLSGTNSEWLKSLIYDLKAMPYCLQTENEAINVQRGFAFSLIGNVEIAHEKSQGGTSTLFKITFSSPISHSLLARKSVSRSLEMLHIKAELATLVWIYLEPCLRANKGICINLSNLIKTLQLPPGKWQKFKSKRKQVFSSAVRELNDRQLIEGRNVRIKIIEGLSDYILHATLEKARIEQNNSV